MTTDRKKVLADLASSTPSQVADLTRRAKSLTDYATPLAGAEDKEFELAHIAALLYVGDQIQALEMTLRGLTPKN